MITNNFLKEYENVTPQVSSAIQVYKENNVKTLQTLQAKHCAEKDNHTPQLVAFVSAARSLGIGEDVVEKYIHSNIHIALDSSKAKHGAVRELIDDNYQRYPVGKYAQSLHSTSSVNKAFEYTTTFSNDYNSYFEKYNSYRITMQSNYPVPDSIILLNGESIATYGNIVAISGLQKSGKSSLCNIILAGCFSDNIDGVPEGIKIKQCDGKAVIHFDTEQAKHHHYNNIKYSVLKRIQLKDAPDNFYTYNIKGVYINKSMQMLDEVCHAANLKHNGIHLLFIDGIADFLNGVNNEEESNAVIKHLECLATKYNMLVIVVIHRNPNDMKVRGHLGSQLLRKCEAVLNMKKDGDKSYIDPEELRTAAKGNIPKYLFAYDKEKRYHCYTGSTAKEEKKGKNELLKDFVSTQMEDGKEYQRSQLLPMICQAMEVKTDMAQKMIKNLSDLEYIEAVPNKKGYWIKVTDATHPFGVQQALAFSEN